MKFVVNITSGPLAGTLEDDNLRGEGRWERLVTRGLLEIGKKVGTSRPKWKGDRPNWLGHVEDLSDCTYLAIYSGPDQPKAARYLFQFFSHPNERIENELREIIAKAKPNSVFLTHSYPSASTYVRLPPDLAARVAWLPMPVPAPVAGDATERTVLFFPARNVADSMAADGGEVMRFVRSALLKDSRLTFEVLSRCTDPAESLWENSVFVNAFADLRERVVVHDAIEHSAVQRIYARTRLVVCPSGYGGPPLESGRCGIPVIALERDCSLYTAPHTPGFPELPRLGQGRSLVQILDRLLYDLPYARRVGEGCRDFVAKNFSPVGFERALHAILDRS